MKRIAIFLISVFAILIIPVFPVQAHSFAPSPHRQKDIGILTAIDPDSKINLRSEPTILSKSLGYGLTGDGVEIQGCSSEFGDTWLQVQFFKPPYATGWIRADFITTQISLEYCH